MRIDPSVEAGVWPGPASSPSYRSPGAPGFSSFVGARTPLRAQEASRYLADAYRAITGSEPARGTLAILWAQWALETGRGKHMYGYNFGGLKGRGPTGGTAELVTREGHGEEQRTIRAPFRTYANPSEGATDFVRTLAQSYPEAFSAAKLEDPDAYVARLHERGYFTGDPREYGVAIRSLSAEHLRASGSGPGFDTSLLHGPGSHPGQLELRLVEGLLDQMARLMQDRVEA